MWKVSSIHLVFESARLWYLKPGWENAPTTQLRSPIFPSHPCGYNFYLYLFPYGFAAAIGTWASISLSISAAQYDDVLPWLVWKTIQIKVRDQLNPLNTWSQTIESKELTRPTSVEFSAVPTVRYPYFFPHSKLFNETDGYLYSDTMYLEISIFDPPISPTQSSFLSLFPWRPPINFNTLSVGWVVALAITLNSASSKFRKDSKKVKIVTYLLKRQLLESGIKVGIAHFETSNFRWHASDGYQRSFSICYPQLSEVWFYCFPKDTPCSLREGSPYLVILGARPTVLRLNLEKYESSAKLRCRPPTVKILTFLIADRQLPSPKAKTTNFSTLL